MKNLVSLLLFLGFSVQALPAARLSAPSLSRKASFQETYNRYPSPFGVIQQLQHIVPYMPLAKETECLTVGSSSAPAIGTIDPLQGSALEEEPSALFYPYFSNCVRSLGQMGFYDSATATANAQEILGDELALELNRWFVDDCKEPSVRPTICLYETDKRAASFWYGVKWQELPEDRRLKLMTAFVEYLVGPEAVLRRQELIGKESAFGIELNSVENLVKFLSDEMEKIKEGVSTLSVLQVYLETAIVLRLGPALKN